MIITAFVRNAFAAAMMCGALCAGVALAEDMPGAQDHPMIGRYDSSEIVGYTITEFDEAKYIDGPFSPGNAENGTGPGFKTAEGKATLIYYKLPQGRSSLEVMRNYEAALKAKGFTIAFTCTNTDGSCFESGQPDAAYFVGSAIGPALSLPKLDDNYVHNWFDQKARYMLGKRAAPQGTVFASLFFGESASGNVVVARIIESKAMETAKIVFLDAGQMEQSLDASGRVSLYGILFDFDRDTLRPDSRPTLEEIAKLMRDKPALRLQIVGHTDNQGTAPYNLDLSARRAGRVVGELATAYAVAPERLTARGAGFTEPVAPNDTEEGRAKNRRVELIAQ
jgi:outer membrane protein OmpA-like peptidoglycan-associated protein